MRMLARKLPFYALTFVIAITIDFFIPFNPAAGTQCP